MNKIVISAEGYKIKEISNNRSLENYTNQTTNIDLLSQMSKEILQSEESVNVIISDYETALSRGLESVSGKESPIKRFLTWLKKFFSGIWQKLKALFKRFWDFITGKKKIQVKDPKLEKKVVEKLKEDEGLWQSLEEYKEPDDITKTAEAVNKVMDDLNLAWKLGKELGRRQVEEALGATMKEFEELQRKKKSEEGWKKIKDKMNNLSLMKETERMEKSVEELKDNVEKIASTHENLPTIILSTTQKVSSVAAKSISSQNKVLSVVSKSADELEFASPSDKDSLISKLESLIAKIYRIVITVKDNKKINSELSQCYEELQTIRESYASSIATINKCEYALADRFLTKTIRKSKVFESSVAVDAYTELALLNGSNTSNRGKIWLVGDAARLLNSFTLYRS